jgi:chemotaxis protein methyltransferase CheR/type IV pilus assembly protein PilK
MAIWSLKSPVDLTLEQSRRWQQLVEQRSGLNLSQHRAILQTGLLARMREIGIDDYDQYFEFVSADPAGAIEWQLLIDRISVKETSFFRDPLAFEAVKVFIEQKLTQQQAKPVVDLWSVGCASGEEVYSLAMLVASLLEQHGREAVWGVQGTDISRSALKIARQGCYPVRKFSQIPKRLRHYWLKVDDGNYCCREELRSRLCFVQGNLLQFDRAPRTAMDVVFCQNLLVYFRREVQHQALDILAQNLKPGGLLIVGPGEASGWYNPRVKRTNNERVQAYQLQE